MTQSLTEAINKARSEALDITELDKRKDIAENLGNAFLSHHITGEEFEERSVMEDVPQGRMDMDNIEVFELAMRILNVDQETIEWTLRHEQEHFEVALSLGLLPKFTIQFAKPGSFYPGIWFDMPKGLSDAEYREKLKIVMEAPKELSPRDQNVLGH